MNVRFYTDGYRLHEKQQKTEEIISYINGICEFVTYDAGANEILKRCLVRQTKCVWPVTNIMLPQTACVSTMRSNAL